MTDIHRIVELLVGSVPKARKVVIPGVGHMINLEAPDVFDLQLQSFLADLDKDISP